MFPPAWWPSSGAALCGFDRRGRGHALEPGFTRCGRAGLDPDAQLVPPPLPPQAGSVEAGGESAIQGRLRLIAGLRDSGWRVLGFVAALYWANGLLLVICLWAAGYRRPPWV